MALETCDKLMQLQLRILPVESIFEGTKECLLNTEEYNLSSIDINRIVCVPTVLMEKLGLVNFQWISIVPSFVLLSTSSSSSSEDEHLIFKCGFPCQVCQLSDNQLEIYNDSEKIKVHNVSYFENNIFLTSTCLQNLKFNTKLRKLYEFSSNIISNATYCFKPLNLYPDSSTNVGEKQVKLSIKKAKQINLVRVRTTFNYGASSSSEEQFFNAKAIDKLLNVYFRENKYVSVGDVISISGRTISSIGEPSLSDSFIFSDPILYLQVRRIEDEDGMIVEPVNDDNNDNTSSTRSVEEKQEGNDEELIMYLYSASVNKTSVYLSSDQVNSVHPSLEKDAVRTTKTSSSPCEDGSIVILPVCVPLLQNYLDRLSEWLVGFKSVRSSLHVDNSSMCSEDINSLCNSDELWPTCLLNGPVGSGKFTLAKAFALKHGFNFHCMNLVSMIGDTSAFTIAKLTAAFQKVKSESPCVFFIKNLQLLARDKEGHEDKRVSLGFRHLLNDIIYHQNSKQGSEKKQQSKLKPHENMPEIYIIGSTDCIEKVCSNVLDCFIFVLSLESTRNSDDIREYIEWMIKRQPTLRLEDSLNLKTWIETNNANNILKTLGDLSAFLSLVVRKAYIEATTGENQKLDSCGSEIVKEATLPCMYHFDCSPNTMTLYQRHFDVALGELEKDVRSSIGSPRIPTVKWEDVGGLAGIKTELIDSVQLPLKFPHLFTSGLKRSGILLYGPPGTGKTLLAKAVASEFKINFFSVKGPELLNMYVGQSEQNVREVFDKARESAPCVVFFDELDSLAPNRGKSGDSGGVMDRVVSQILAEMDGTHSTPNVFVIGATNRPDLIDPALLRPGRFDKLIYVGISEDKGAVESILKALTRKFNLDEDVNLAKMAEELPVGMTGADLYSFCSEAFVNAISRRIQLLESGESRDIDSPVVVNEEDFMRALKCICTSLPKSELRKYENLKTMMR